MQRDDSEPDRGTKIPTSRSSRLASMASLGASVAGGVLSEGAKQLMRGNRPQLREMLLTPTNARKLGEKLKQLRGAALKVGQLLSMDTGEFIPPELAEILAHLRDDVEPMPFSQLTKLLHEELGPDWHAEFEQFSFSPMAAASIGQVHSARDLAGNKMALKIQYPGVSQSIDSDVDNVGTLLKISGLLPSSTNIKEILEETKQQLHAETDYLLEAAWIKQYEQYLQGQEEFIVPKVSKEFTTEKILAMSFHHGQNIDTLIDLDQVERDAIAASLIKLIFQEMFVFQCVQTDPNFANFMYQKDTKKLVLLDFGAARKLPDHISQGYLALLRASLKNDDEAIEKAVNQIGFFQEEIAPQQKEHVIRLFHMACEPLGHDGEFDFASSNLATKISKSATSLSLKKDYWHTPPTDALFLHRKIGGLYLIAAKLRAKVNVKELFQPYL